MTSIVLTGIAGLSIYACSPVLLRTAYSLLALPSNTFIAQWRPGFLNMLSLLDSARSFFFSSDSSQKCDRLNMKKSTDLIVHPQFRLDQRAAEVKHGERRFLNLAEEKYRYIWLKSSEIRKPSHFARLVPTDVVPGVLLDYLTAEDLCNVALVSKTWYMLSSQDRLWRRLLFTEFNTDLAELKRPRRKRDLKKIKNFEQLKKELTSSSITPRELYKHLARARRQLLWDAYLRQSAALLSTTYNIPANVSTATFSR